MKKHLFLLGSFMASSLVAANTLLVISCKKKANIKGSKDDEKGTTGQVEFEKVNKLQNEIRNIIDDVITNPSDESSDWIIDLKGEFADNYENIRKFLNDTVEGLKSKPVKDQQVALDQLSDMGSSLKDKITQKFESLKKIIIDRINKNEDIGVSNFKFEFNSETIQPILTALNGTQFIAAISKLKKKSTLYSLNPKAVASEDIDKITEIELFKVKTNLSYNFSFGSIKDQKDSYNNAELLLTGNTGDYKKIKKYTQETIKDIFTKNKAIKDVTIFSSLTNSDYGVTAEEIQTHDFIGKQMDWDFSKQAVKDEIASMQYDNINKLKDKNGKENLDIKEIIKEMKFDAENFDFEIDSSKQMKFDNYSMDLKNHTHDCLVICHNGYPLPSIEGVVRVTEQFFSDDQASNFKNWNGGKINKEFIDQVNKDGKSAEGTNPRINLNEYYGLGSGNDEDKYDSNKNLLIGYGTTTIRKASYAGVALSKIIIDTNLVSPYDPAGMDDLYNEFIKYVKTFLSAIKNEETTGEGKDHGVSLPNASNTLYSWQWGFGNEGEWDIIQTQIDTVGKEGTISFDWIMQNVLYEKRIKGNSVYRNMLPAPNAGVPETTKTSLKSKNGIEYVYEENKYLVAKDDGNTSAIMYLKFGPFTIYLNDNDSRAVWWSNRHTGIGPEWPS